MTEYFAADRTMIEAVLFRGENASEIIEFTENRFRILEEPIDGAVAELFDDVSHDWVLVEAPEYVVKGEDRFFVMATEAFEEEYEPQRN